MNINWYPGHMAKTVRELEEMLKLCDCVIECADARIPDCSRNPDLKKLRGSKPSLLFLNKADLADPNRTTEWIQEFTAQGETVLVGDARSHDTGNEIKRMMLHLAEPILARARARGRQTRPIRTFVIGVPNCGKSTLINTLTGKKSAKTENRPGLTRSLTWLRAGSDLQLLDTPGLLWPKINTDDQGLALASTGAIPDSILPLQDIAGMLLLKLITLYPSAIKARYGELIAVQDDLKGHAVLDQLARNKSLLLGQGEVDSERAARMLLIDFRSASIGRITLEKVKHGKKSD